MRNNLICLSLILTLTQACTKSETRTAVVACTPQINWSDSSATHPKNNAYSKLITDLTDIGLPGINLMIEDQYGVWVKSSGYADIEAQTKMQNCHLAKVASVTKLFTATMIYQLVDGGKLNLNDPISNYIDASIIAKLKNAELCKVRDLLAHSSGIYDIVFDADYILYEFNNLDKKKDYEKILSFAYGKKPAFDYNTKRDYNQTVNHVLLCLIINKITGQDHSKMLRNRIFNPLNMKESYIRPHEVMPWNTIAKGYFDYRKEGTLQDLTALFTGDGTGFTGIYSTVNDMRKFTKALYETKTLISQSSLDEMLNIQTIDSTMGCAGGCRVSEIEVNGNKYTWFGHPGGEVNYAAGVFYNPQLKATITFTVNYGVAFTDMGAYTDAYYDFRKKVFREVCKP
jgi:D-alanyl-D-alanine carboxypeptidase